MTFSVGGDAAIGTASHAASLVAVAVPPETEKQASTAALASTSYNSSAAAKASVGALASLVASEMARGIGGSGSETFGVI